MKVREAAPSYRASRYLLDVNVLLALLDPRHVFHDQAHAWFKHTGGRAWATCPIVENGVIRIASQPRYPNPPGPASLVMAMLKTFCTKPGHLFWPDNISMCDEGRFAYGILQKSSQLTDTYLLALAASRKGFLATFDRQLIADAVVGGNAALHVIG